MLFPLSYRGKRPAPQHQRESNHRRAGHVSRTGFEPATFAFGKRRSSPAELAGYVVDSGVALTTIGLGLPRDRTSSQLDPGHLSRCADSARTPKGTRTPNLRVRSAALCPVELQAYSPSGDCDPHADGHSQWRYQPRLSTKLFATHPVSSRTRLGHRK